MAAIKFGVSQNKVIWRLLNLASRWPFYAVYDRRICWWPQILAKTRNSPNIIARQNLLIYSIKTLETSSCFIVFKTKVKMWKVSHETNLLHMSDMWNVQYSMLVLYALSLITVKALNYAWDLLREWTLSVKLNTTQTL